MNWHIRRPTLVFITRKGWKAWEIIVHELAVDWSQLNSRAPALYLKLNVTSWGLDWTLNFIWLFWDLIELLRTCSSKLRLWGNFFSFITKDKKGLWRKSYGFKGVNLKLGEIYRDQIEINTFICEVLCVLR